MAFYAICVGINKAPGTAPLAFAELDARKVHSRLSARGFDSTLLAGSTATVARWLSAVEDVVAQAAPGDQVVLFFSGHGRPVPNDNQESSYRKIIDEVEDDEVFRLWDGELLDDVLRAQVSRLEGCHVLLMIDSCRAGGFRDVLDAAFPTGAASVQLLAACEEDGTSWGDPATGSFFTDALLQVLDQPEAPETFDEWYQTALKLMSEHIGQRPRYFSSTSAPLPFRLGSNIPSLDLDDIQAHVLYGFSHLPHHWLCFFRIADPRAFARALREDRFELTSAKSYLSKPSRACALALSYEGLAALEAPSLDHLGASDERTPNTFRSDCIGRSIPLGDPVTGYGRPEQWKVGGPYGEQRPGGLLILAGLQSVAELQRLGESLLSMAGLHLVFAEEGSWHRDSRESFGFLDGLSKPGVGARPATPEPHPGVIPQSATSVHALDTLLLGEQVPGLEWAVNGSFLVYRRLVQDVATFSREMQRLATARGRRGRVPQAIERAEERVFGRRKRDGTPLALASGALESAGDTEAFDYATASGCPLAAHVRKCNARLTTLEARAKLGVDRFPVIYRRGVLFGSDSAQRATMQVQMVQAPLEAAEQGLHFMCYQASIERQYEFVLRHSVNNPEFPEPNSGVDALIGALPRRDGGTARPVNLDGTLQGLEQFVLPTGGGYFFTATLSGLRELGHASGTELPQTAASS